MYEVEVSQPSIRPKRIAQPQGRFLLPLTLPPALNTQIKPGVAQNYGAPEKPSLCARCAMTAQNCRFSQMANGSPKCKKLAYKQAVGVYNNREVWLYLSVHWPRSPLLAVEACGPQTTLNQLLVAQLGRPRFCQRDGFLPYPIPHPSAYFHSAYSSVF